MTGTKDQRKKQKTENPRLQCLIEFMSDLFGSRDQWSQPLLLTAQRTAVCPFLWNGSQPVLTEPFQTVFLLLPPLAQAFRFGLQPVDAGNGCIDIWWTVAFLMNKQMKDGDNCAVQALRHRNEFDRCYLRWNGKEKVFPPELLFIFPTINWKQFSIVKTYLENEKVILATK